MIFSRESKRRLRGRSRTRWLIAVEEDVIVLSGNDWLRIESSGEGCFIWRRINRTICSPPSIQISKVTWGAFRNHLHMSHKPFWWNSRNYICLKLKNFTGNSRGIAKRFFFKKWNLIFQNGVWLILPWLYYFAIDLSTNLFKILILLVHVGHFLPKPSANCFQPQRNALQKWKIQNFLKNLGKNSARSFINYIR